MAVEEARGTSDFADVYRAQLAAVWRYVRSRVPNHHEAQDVTSEVFARAWRSWGGFDATRGSIAPWLLRIAQRTVQDWLRRQGRGKPPAPVDQDILENALADPSEMPETVLIAKEVLAEVSQALAELTDRERDGIALRFGAGLKLADIGAVLGLSPGATKMMMARAIGKLAVTVSKRHRAPTAATPLLLDSLVDQALERGQLTSLAPELRDLVLQLAVIHRPPMPGDLPKQVQFCVDCSTGFLRRIRARLPFGDHRPPPPAALRFGLAPSIAFSWAPLAPVCLACTVQALVAPLLALGLSLDVAYGLHALSLFAAPFVFLVLWRHFKRHANRLVLWMGGIGAALLVAHLVGHLLIPDGIPLWSVIADQLGTAMVLVGTLLDAGALRGWVRRQREQLAVAAADFRLVRA
jgi:RNA polymerase sigma factor (sigma-70 family)